MAPARGGKGGRSAPTQPNTGIFYYYTNLSYSVLFSKRLKLSARTRNLNDIMFANIQKRHMDMVKIDAAAKDFGERNERRMTYFGKYERA